MPLVNTFSSISKRGFGGFVSNSSNGEWVTLGPAHPTPNLFSVPGPIAISEDGGRFSKAEQRSLPNGLVVLTDNFGVTSSSVYTGISVEHTGIAMSYNGQYQLISRESTSFAKSINFGASWSAVNVDASSITCSCAVSYNGEFQAVLAFDGSTARIYRSANFGSTWAVAQTFTNPTFRPGFNSKLAMSADGQIQICGASFNRPFVSTNYGVTWVELSSFPVEGAINVCAISSDATRMVFAHNNGYIYVSEDSGTNWAQRGDSRLYWGAAMSGDGLKISVIDSATSQVAMSSDGGTSFSYVTPTDLGPTVTFAKNGIGISRDGRVQVLIGSSNPKINII